MAFEELLVIVLLFWLRTRAAIGVGKLGDNEHRNYRDSVVFGSLRLTKRQ